MLMVGKVVKEYPPTQINLQTLYLPYKIYWHTAASNRRKDSAKIHVPRTEAAQPPSSQEST